MGIKELFSFDKEFVACCQ